jgi:hypothetical protein
VATQNRVTTIAMEFTSADVVRTLLAVALTVSFPFVLFFSDANVFSQTYENAVTAVVGFYFAVRSAEGGRVSQVASVATPPA